MQQQENMNRYEAFVLETLLACVDRATADLRPARMGFATGKSYVNVNRNADLFTRTKRENGSLLFVMP